MKRVKIYFVCILVLLIVVSCSIDKRIYSKGYHIEWKQESSFNLSKSPRSLPNETNYSIEEIKSEEFIKKEEITNYTDVLEEIEIFEVSKENYSIVTNTECDSIILRNKNVILGNIAEINSNTIRYTKCHASNNIIREVKKNEINYIKFSDGTIEEFENVKEVSEEAVVGTLLSGIAIFIASLASGIGLLVGILAFVFSFISIVDSKSNLISYLSMIVAIASIVIIVLLFL